MKLKLGIGLGLPALVAFASAVAPVPVKAADLWEAWTVNGGPSYCAAYVTGATGSQICQITVPQGEGYLTGYEVIPSDLGPLGQTSSNGGPQSGLFQIQQLGNGLLVDQTTVGTTQTISNQTAFFMLDGAQGSAFTVTLPAAPVDGQIVRVGCLAATVGNMTIAANTGQTLKPAWSAVACTAGNNYAFRYVASTPSTLASYWVRIQ